MDNKPILEVKHLCKYFSSKNAVMKAVDDVNFQVFKGETFGLVGESGCGKTTTGRTIIRLYKPTSGEVWFNGARIDGQLNKEETRAVTSKMQMIFQDPVASLNPRMTVEEIIAEGAKINGIFHSKEELKENVKKMLELVGLTSEHATRYPHEFSGGQRQRICIARALITKPDLIIADEPISALDVSIQAQVLNLLNDLPALPCTMGGCMVSCCWEAQSFCPGCCFSALDFGGWCATWGCLIPPSMELSACLERQKSTLSSIWSRTRTGKVSGKRFSWAFCLWQFPSVFDIISYLRKNPRSENPVRCGGFAA